MKCPHCLDGFFEDWQDHALKADSEGVWKFRFCKCPSCRKFICLLVKSKWIKTSSGSTSYLKEVKTYLVRPRAISRSPISKEIPEKYSEDYKEACLVLSDSPKASAALSRRCLQNLLREVAKVKHANLSDEIQQVIDSKTIPSHLSESIDAIRNIGNFAAHPIKSEKAGEIINVEPGEAEWSLDVLEALFDFYFVQPAKLKAKRGALNKKLKEASKPKMK